MVALPKLANCCACASLKTGTMVIALLIIIVIVTVIVINNNITIIINITRPKPPSGRQGLAGLWGKDTVRQAHYKVFSTSHFAPMALSSSWILLFKCGYENSTKKQ